MDVKVEEILSSFQQQVDTFKEFLLIIPWHETWMVCLMAFHFLFCLPFVLLTKKYHNLQYVVFFSFLVLVYMAETINAYAAKHWEVFSNENYFDSNGLFISTVFSAPILMNCVLLIVVWLYTAGNMLVGVKKKQVESELTSSRTSSSKDDRKRERRRRKRRHGEEEDDSKEDDEEGSVPKEEEDEETRKNK